MSISDTQRAEIGARVKARRPRVYDRKKDAYNAADVHPDTWNKVEDGLSVSDISMRKVVRTLWPETDGEWQKIPLEDAPALEPAAETDRLAHLEAAVAELTHRVEALEITRAAAPVMAESRDLPGHPTSPAQEAKRERRRVPRD